MSYTIALDPGVKIAGIACYGDGELACAWLVQGKSWNDTAWQAWAELRAHVPEEVIRYANVVIEKPQVYTQNKLVGDPNDLIDVAMMAACFAGKLHPDTVIKTYLPRQWKGQVPKAIMTKRIIKRLSEAEHERIELPIKSLRHNVYDAAGLGLYYERRLKR